MDKPIFPSFLRRKKRTYVFLGFYLFMAIFFLAESLVSIKGSKMQSDFITSTLYKIVPSLNDNKVEPTKMRISKIESALASDDKYIDDDPRPDFVVGEYSKVYVEFEYPSGSEGKALDKKFTATMANNASCFGTVENIEEGYFTINPTAKAEKCSIYLSASNYIHMDFVFDVVERVAPTSYTLSMDGGEIPSSISLKANETKKIDISLESPYSYDKRFLTTIYDAKKLPSSSSDPSIASIDEYGVVHAYKEGRSRISYGNSSFEVIVLGIGESADSSSSISISKIGGNSYEGDYLSYRFSGGTVLEASFGGKLPSDQSITWISSDEHQLRIIPIDGEPLRVRAVGHYMRDDIKVYAISNASPSLKAEYLVERGHLYPSKLNAECLIEGVGNFTLDENLKEINIPMHGIARIHFLPEEGVRCTDYGFKKVSSSSFILTPSGADNYFISLTPSLLGQAKLKIELENPSFKPIEIKVNIFLATGNAFKANIYHISRKIIGHAAYFFVMGVFGFLFGHFYFDDSKKDWMVYLFGAVNGFMVAIFSELFQMMSAGRIGLWADIIYDWFYLLVGSLICFGVCFLAHYIKKRKEKAAIQEE